MILLVNRESPWMGKISNSFLSLYQSYMNDVDFSILLCRSNYRIPGHLKYSMLNSNIQAVNKDEFQKYIFIPDPNPRSFP